MAWISFVLNAVALLCAGCVGWDTRRVDGRRLMGYLFFAGLVMCVRAFLYAHPEHEQVFLSLSDNYLYFAAWEAPVATFMVFALLARLGQQRTRQVAVFLMILLSPLFLWESFAPCVEPNYAMAARFDDDGVCRQSTDYSCGPAAAVMMAQHAGREISEGEMAQLCLLKAHRGVTALELCRGLNIALRPEQHRARIRRVAPAELGGVRRPFLAELVRGGQAEHCVMVVEVAADSLILADPARGRYATTRDGFVKQWTGIVITLESLAPATGQVAWLGGPEAH